MHRHVDDLASRHLDVADVPIPKSQQAERYVGMPRQSLLVEEGLEDDDLVARFDECHKSAQHAWTTYMSVRIHEISWRKRTFIRAGGNGNLSLGVKLPSPVRSIGI